MAAGPALGVDVGGTKLLAVRLAPDGAPEAELLLPTPRTVPDLKRSLAEVVEELAGGHPGSLGVGLPGLVDAAGRFAFSPHLSGAIGAVVAGERVWAGNDATAAVWAEHRVGAAAGVDDVLMITLGTGIGGGVVAAARLIEGAHRFAGEFGHMVLDPEGPACPCGRRGCWERYASGPTLAAMAGMEKGEHVTAAALRGDPAALEALGRLARWVARGLVNLVTAFDPEVVVVGGGLVAAGELLLAPLRSAFSEMAYAAAARGPVPIRGARFGPSAGAVGAALLAAGDH